MTKYGKKKVARSAMMTATNQQQASKNIEKCKISEGASQKISADIFVESPKFQSNEGGAVNSANNENEDVENHANNTNNIVGENYLMAPASKQVNNSTNSIVTSKLEMILSELENGCFAEAAKDSKGDPVGYLRKKMAALGFQAGIQLSGSGAVRDARKILEGFPGDDEYELTFEEGEETDIDSNDCSEISTSSSETDSDSDSEYSETLRNEELIYTPSDDEDEDVLLSDDFLLGLDPLRALTNTISASSSTNKTKSKGKASTSKNPAGSDVLNYPLIDPLKLQVIQSAESELTTVHDLFESKTISPTQKLPLLKRKYMELMQQDIRHRLESLRVRDYLDTLHLERQVVERELEKALELKVAMEQLCEQLSLENSKIKAERVGISEKIFAELELQSLMVSEEDSSAAAAGGKNGKKGGKNSGASNNNNNKNTNSKGKKQKSPSSTYQSHLQSLIVTGNSINIPTTLPEPLKPITYELPDATRLLEGVQGDILNRVQLLIDIYNQREGHFLSVLKAKDAEISLLQTVYYSNALEIQRLRRQNRELSTQVNSLNVSESDLRAQLSIYVDKFKQVEDTLAKSNDLFATFRHEMEQMTGKLGRLEKDNQSLQTKCSTLSRNIIEMADERTKQAASIDLLKTQKTKLENLCRSLQAERNAALNKSTI